MKINRWTRFKKSILAGLSSYKATANAIGLLAATIGLISLIEAIFGIRLADLLSTVIETYRSILVVPLQRIFDIILGWKIHSWVLDSIYIYLLVGGAVVRSKLDLFSNHYFQTQMEHSMSLNVLKQENPRKTWKSFVFFFIRINRLIYQTPQQKPDFWYRMNLFYRFSPRAFRITFDLLLLPLSLAHLFQNPVLVEIDNRQNPEDNGPSLWPASDYEEFKPWPNENEYWMNAFFMFDYRFFFFAQLIGLVLAVLAFLSINVGLSSFG